MAKRAMTPRSILAPLLVALLVAGVGSVHPAAAQGRGGGMARGGGMGGGMGGMGGGPMPGGGMRGGGGGGLMPGLMISIPGGGGGGYIGGGPPPGGPPPGGPPPTAGNGNTRGNRGGGGGGGGGGAPTQANQSFVPNEVVTAFAQGTPPQAINAVAQRYGLTQLETQNFALIGVTLYRWRIGPRATVPNLVRVLGNERSVASVQPNFLFTLQEDIAKAPAGALGNGAQYVLDKLQVGQAQQIATGKTVRVAMIDSRIDLKLADLDGSIAKSFDAVAGSDKPHPHGTSIAGAIVSHGRLTGIAPGAELFAVIAFDDSPGVAKGTSFAIYKGLQWAADNAVRVVNMSFAGPADPLLQKMLTAAYDKGMVLIAAAGNAGPQSPPLYPAADPHVIAVTATDKDDKLFRRRQSRPLSRGRRPGRRDHRAGARRQDPILHRHVDRRRPCQRHRGAAVGARPVAQAERHSRGADRDRQAAWAAEGGFRFWRGLGQRLSRRDVARPQPGAGGRRRHASEAVIRRQRHGANVMAAPSLPNRF